MLKHIMNFIVSPQITSSIENNRIPRHLKMKFLTTNTKMSRVKLDYKDKSKPLHKYPNLMRLRRDVLGHSLGSFGHSVLGELSREQ